LSVSARWALAAFLLFLLGCGSGPTVQREPTIEPAPAPTEEPPPTATPQPEDLGPGSIELIRRGWERIVEFHIDVPEERPLLTAAWRSVSAEARRNGLTAPPQPALDGDREAMWASFEGAYLALLEAAPEETWQGYRFAALTGMAESLDDCHTFFLPPRRSDVLEDLRSGRASGGVGLEIAAVRPAYVREVIGGSPAQQAGLQPGDVLLSVDGRDVSTLGVEVITDVLRGEPGSAVSIEVRRPSTGATITFPLVRALVQAPGAEGRALSDGAGYIRIRSFTSGSSLREAVDRAVADFEAAGIKAWVLDLRDNPGGDTDLDLAGRFIGVRRAEHTLLRGGRVEVQDGRGSPYPDRPMAVLVNNVTASVAEIFAAMLQDHGRARVFGSQTNRCAGFVHLEMLPDESTLGVTIGHSLTPVTEKPLWQTGVIPDQVVNQTQADTAAGRDPILDAALAWLRTQTP
jgi:carboxyl-terminal processing protease